MPRTDLFSAPSLRTDDHLAHDLRHHAPPTATGDDELEAMRTIPRGLGPDDVDPTPAVDPDVWLAHVSYARTRDPRLLDRLVAEYDRYATSLARRLDRGGEPREDLEQLAREALVVALGRFDPERGLPFPSYATPTILGAVRRHYRDHGWLVRVPRRVHELATSIRSATDALIPQLGRQPTLLEVAECLGVPIDDLVEAEEARFARSAASLDLADDDRTRLGDVLGSEDLMLGLADDRSAVRDAMASLDERSREALRLYFFEDLSQTAIGERFGVSQMQVSRLLAAALRRLRSQVGAR